MARVLLRELATGVGSERIGGLGLEVADGAAAAILGDDPKSLRRLVRALAGLEPIQQGALFLDGIDVTDTAADRRGIAVVFAGGALFPHLDVRGNIEVGLKWRGLAKSERDARVQDAAARLGFEARLGLAVDRLSAADRVRVGLARALVREPVLVVLEDVFAEVETSERGTLRADVVRALRRSRRTFLAVTRDAGEAFAIAEQVAFVHRGACVQVGSPDALTKSPVALPVARATGALVLEAGAQDRKVVLGGVALELPAERANAAVAFPPEALALGAGGAIELGGTVELVEALPPREAAVQVRVQSQTLSFRVPRAEAPRLGDEVRLHVDPQAAMFFDPASGQRLAPEPMPETFIPPAPPTPQAPETTGESATPDETVKVPGQAEATPETPPPAGPPHDEAA